MKEIAYLRVRNWDKFQHYKDKGGAVPWIKLHTTLLNDYEFLALPEAKQGRLMKLWLLAARTGNRIPHDRTWVARQIGARTINLDLLIDCGYLEPVYSDSREALSLAEQSRTEESRAEQMANGHYEIDERAISKLLESLTDKDAKTERTIRKIATQFSLQEGDFMFARECALGPGVDSPAAVAVSTLKKRGNARLETKGTR